jgi:uncharacterized protein (TIGR02118 family)
MGAQGMDRRAVLVWGVVAATAAGSAVAEGQERASPGGARSGSVKVIALYDRPDDPEAFFKHYETVHAPLVKRTPGLQSFVLNRVTADAFGGVPRYALIAEMTYAGRAAFDAAMRSPENQAVGQDLMSFAKGKVSVVIADSAEA